MSRLDEILSQPTITHDLVQGSPEWDGFRLTHRGASEAAVMLGLSKKATRTELLTAKKTGLGREFSDFVQRILDNGHDVEAKARPIIEERIGHELYPATLSRGQLSASCDGITLDNAFVLEHKQWNEELAAAVRAGHLPDEFMPQCQQIMLVTGAHEVEFVVSDGTPENMVSMLVNPDRAWWERIVNGWAQFDVDLESFELPAIKEMPKAEVTLALPALFIHAKGEITTSNMKEYGEALAKRLAEVRAITLVTDQDFSNAKESAKLLRENIQQAKLAKDAMLAQTVTVGEAARMIDSWCEDMRLTALKLEQDVEREDKAKKAAMIAKARAEYDQHIEALKVDTGGPWIVMAPPNFPEAIKNKRNFTSMQDALDTMLANAKIAADDSARKIRAALSALAEESKGWEHLFADRLSFISKAPEDVRLLARARITEHQAAEQRRAEALAEKERERIRAEEQEKAEREAREKLQREQDAARAAQQAQASVAPAGPQRAANDAPPTAPAVLPIARTTQGKPDLSLGVINQRIAPLSITEAGLAKLGFKRAGHERSTVLYHDADFPAMVDSMVAQLRTAQQRVDEPQAA
jgi:predicted phage-related endonuclease